jgi:glycosyltransferase involved in cell wall biosynthesis
MDERPKHIRLTIGICTFNERSNLLERLLKVLRPQLTLEVQLLIQNDHAQVTIGQTRQNALNRAVGDYFVMIDDDDLIPPYYVSSILEAIKSNPDCVSIRCKKFVNGKENSITQHDMKYDRDQPGTSNDPYETPFRPINHLCPVRLELAKQVAFKPLDAGEDCDYGMRLQPLLKTQVKIDAIMYEYHYVSHSLRKENSHRRQQEDKQKRGLV